MTRIEILDRLEEARDSSQAFTFDLSMSLLHNLIASLELLEHHSIPDSTIGYDELIEALK